ncbi:chorismate mutase [Mycobacterium bourgelatii]|uniref:Chorismate mutase n=1 Tax=Mycobacterium bourgelatii TaxID=1273442 RepID=A0A7I9YQ17_MYCBU|nr:chorismate mutase [Mycobacterium bourgelatii]MCV6976130.1 chorismate mutase [Mycobacterium bourgelatii]GFG90764.1 secreted chorismate mutase [Mycobacterium bourgelatii]
MASLAVGTVATGVATPARADSPLRALVDAAAERLEVADPVAAFKWSTQGAIEDPARVEQELSELGQRAAAEQLDPDYVTRVFRDQISATEAIEYSRFAEWKLDAGATAPAAPPDLTASRAAIDTLNTKILSQIAANWSLLDSPSCATELQHASAEIIRARHFDNLYQRALTTATRSYCRNLPGA